jgi:hypothetical protein
MLNTLRGLAVAVVAVAALSVPARAAIPPAPGVVNYIEGAASIDGRSVTSKDIGSAQVNQNQILATGLGKAEMLLTPGVLLRAGANTQVRMVSPSLTDTRVEVLRGEAMVEATDLHKENNIRILEQGTSTTLAKNGLYDFDANNGVVSVYDGKAVVQGDDNQVKASKGKQVALSGHLKAVSFDRGRHDDLYSWSSVRSQDLSVANMRTAGLYAGNPYAYGSYGSGWYWNPYFASYSFFPVDGFLYSPFGYGFYSPWAFYGGGYRGRVIYRSGSAPARGVFRGGSVPVAPQRGGFSSGGSRSSGGGFQGGGARHR